MKKFEDLKFEPHPIVELRGIQAKITMPDGTNISVIQGEHFYSGEITYEVMSDRMKGSGVRGWLSPNQITNHMMYVQRNPKK